MRLPNALLATLAAALVAGCASERRAAAPRPSEVRALVAELLPPNLPDRAGWAADIHAAFSALDIEPSVQNVCAAIAVTEQESSFRADPAVPNLGAIAWDEIDRRAERLGVPKLVVRGALQITSSNGRSYAARIDTAKTERELSDIFEDFVGLVPMGERLFGDYNPVRTGGPMQVGVAFAERFAKDTPYPYPVDGSIRHEVFTRRGGMYFGIAHLLDYPAAYDKPLYRFADYNAGRYASRNAAFQNAVTVVTGIPLALDGDLLRRDDASPGATETAVRSLGRKLDLSDSAIRRALEQGEEADFERTAVYRRVFELAEQLERRALPRAVVPRIALKSPKITRRLTTEWFAQRVEERHRRCVARAS